MKGAWFTLCVLFAVFFSFSQTGPAGVGTATNNVLWLRADAGTSSTTNGAVISSWADQSGNAINVTQTVAVQQPSFATNVINGFPAILFDNVNSTNQNDKLIGPDSPLLDSTNGYSFFYVTRPMNFGDAHVILSKRTTVSVDQSFMLFYYTSNKLYVDIETTNDRFNSNTTYTTATNYLGSLIYDGTATTNSRCALYSEETFDRYAAETSTLVPNNASPLLIGTTDATDPRPFGGYIAEVILYRTALNTAQRIIVNNSMSAKYNIALSANDKYLGDNPANGDYDRDVAGIGQESTGSNTSFSASVTKGLTMSVNSGLDNTDYLLVGNALATNTTITTDIAGITGTNTARWQRIWYVDVTNTGANININLEFDMSDGGMNAFTLGATSNYVLLYRAAQTGTWQEVTTASSITGDRIQFNSLTITNDGYMTLGTRNYFVSPLPLTLLNFTAQPDGKEVMLNWSTASEKNNALFTLERSKDGTSFESIGTRKGAGNSSVRLNYSYIDPDPYPGTSYYRLKQTDYDGQASYSGIVAVSLQEEEKELIVFPNPNSGSFQIKFPDEEVRQISVTITDALGKQAISSQMLSKSDDGFYHFFDPLLVPGTYILSASSDTAAYSRRLIIR